MAEPDFSKLVPAPDSPAVDPNDPALQPDFSRLVAAPAPESEKLPDDYAAAAKKFDRNGPQQPGVTPENWTGYGPEPTGYQPTGMDKFVEAIGGHSGFWNRLEHPFSSPTTDPELTAVTASHLGDAGRVAAGVASFGLADKMQAGLDTLTNGKSYDENAQAEKDQTKKSSDSLPPGERLGAEALGMVGPGKIASMVDRSAATVGGRIAGQAITSGLESGTAAYNAQDQDKSMGEKAEGSVIPAVVGAAGAAGLAKLGDIAGNVAKSFVNSAYNKKFGNQLEADAADHLTDMIMKSGAPGATESATGIGAAQTKGALKALGPNGTLIDTGPAPLNAAAALAQDPKLAATMMANLVRRASSLAQTTKQMLTNITGRDFNYSAAIDDLKHQMQHVDGPNYAAAKAAATPVDMSPVLANIRKQLPMGTGDTAELTPIQQKLASYGRMLENDPATPLVPGQPPPPPKPLSIEHTDQVLKALKDDITKAYDSGAKSEGDALNTLKNQIMASVTANGANGAYVIARAGHATESSLQEAQAAGRKVFAGKQEGEVFDPDMLQAQLNNYSQTERAAYLASARKAIQDKIQAAGDEGQLGALQKITKPGTYAYDKMKLLFGPNAVDEFQGNLAQRAIMEQSNATIKSAADAAAGKAGAALVPKVPQKVQLEDDPLHMLTRIGLGEAVNHGLTDPTAIGLAVGGRVLKAGRNMLTNMGLAGRQAAAQLSREHLANALTGDPTEVLKALSARGATGQRAAMTQARVRGYPNALIGALNGYLASPDKPDREKQ